MLLKVEGPDIWDPNNWDQDEHEHRIYGDQSLETYAVVDAIDYPYLCQFKWSIHTFRIGKRGSTAFSNTRKKFYLRRGVSEFHGPDGERYESPFTGYVVRHRNRVQRTVFLHQEIMQRMGALPPTPKHVIIDHKDRNTWNCRRENLHWLTRSGNALNVD